MGRLVVLGLQWGDEGKGKVVDLLCPSFGAVVRYQGGHNAGHTVRFDERHFALHLIPSGILRPPALCLLGGGMVISPQAFAQEVAGLEEAGIAIDGRLLVSDRAHLLLPQYAALDAARERGLGERAIGTTARGIGPAYEAKAARIGLRFCDLSDPALRDRLAVLLARLDAEAVSAGGEGSDLDQVLAHCAAWREAFAPYLVDAQETVGRWLAEGVAILFEGAQGALLDLDHGTYPYVTSSSATAAGACLGSGVPPSAIDGVLGVLKAYTSRVGAGPFPSELFDATGDFLRERGNEFGTTTGRPRRCGWLDLVAVRQAVEINGVRSVALTKLDVLDALPEIGLVTAYELDGRRLERLPAAVHELERCRPVLRTVPGWQQPTAGHLDYEALPAAARDYVELLERELGVSVHLVSTGPRREETIVRRDAWWDSVVGGPREVAPPS